MLWDGNSEDGVIGGSMKRIKSFLPKLFLKVNGTKYGKKISLYGYPFIFRYPNAEISMGENVTINSGFLSNLIGLYQRCIIVARGNGKIHIGNHVGISGVTIYARKEITIEDDVNIGANTKIFDNDFHSLDHEERKNDIFDNLKCKPVRIGKNAFIGCNCIILKGTEIGENCIVGAGSVVHGKYEANSVIAGNPARIIRNTDGKKGEKFG